MERSPVGRSGSTIWFIPVIMNIYLVPIIFIFHIKAFKDYSRIESIGGTRLKLERSLNSGSCFSVSEEFNFFVNWSNSYFIMTGINWHFVNISYCHRGLISHRAWTQMHTPHTCFIISCSILFFFRPEISYLFPYSTRHKYQVHLSIDIRIP